MHKREVLSIMKENGYELMEELSIINGFKLFFDNGAIVSIVNDEHVTLEGQSQEIVAEMLGLNEGKVGAKSGVVAKMLAEEDDEEEDEFAIDMGPEYAAESAADAAQTASAPTPAPASPPAASSAPTSPMPSVVSAGTGRKVLLSCGSDEEACAQLEGLIRGWGMEPLPLCHLDTEGQTVVEKLANLSDDVCFGIVIASPDDEGYRVGHPDEVSHRAQQNVVLEMGMMLSRLGRKRVAILLKHQEDMQRPSDIQGLNYIPYFDDIEKDVGTLLAKEIQTYGAGAAV
ncbi:MAG: TIR domain-containing protein [Planctomycetota bacterium]|jgi:predicted nucleotide-binding protein